MAVLEMCDCEDVDDHRLQGHGDGVSYVVGDGQEDGLGALRPLHCVYLVVLPHPSDAHLDLRTDIMLPSDGFTRKSRRAAESATPPGHSHMKTETGMNLDVVGYGEDDEDSTCVVNCVGFLYPADVFLELRHTSEETTETRMNRVVVGNGEDDEKTTYLVNCLGVVHPADVFLVLRDGAGEMLWRVRLLSESEVGFGDGDAGVEKLGRVRLLSESEVGFRDGDAGEEKLGRMRLLSESEVEFRDAGDAGEELVRPPIIADEEYWVDDPVPPEFSWEHVLGSPMPQIVPGTCALVAATVCLEAQHRLRFEEKYGRGTFPCRAAAPRKLRVACFRDEYLDRFTGKRRRTWAPGQGAYTGRMLTKLKQLGGARTTNAPPPAPFFLPLADWTFHSYDDDLTHQTAARLIFQRGPCIGSLFSIPGCRREDREMLMKKDPGHVGMHAVVCYAYRYTKRGKKLKIQVLDNQWPHGGTRWVDFEEFDCFYVLDVYPLPPRHLLVRSPPLVYPLSGVM